MGRGGGKTYKRVTTLSWRPSWWCSRQQAGGWAARRVREPCTQQQASTVPGGRGWQQHRAAAAVRAAATPPTAPVCPRARGARAGPRTSAPCRLRTFPQAVALLLHAGQEGGCVDGVEHAARHVAHQRVAGERGAVVAWGARPEGGRGRGGQGRLAGCVVLPVR